MVDKAMGSCVLCNQILCKTKKGLMGTHCSKAKISKRNIKSDEICWADSLGLKKSCSDLLKKNSRLRPPKFTKLGEFLKSLVEKSEEGEASLEKFLIDLTDNERYFLMQYANGEIGLLLAEIFNKYNLVIREDLISLEIPEDLPDDFILLLESYKNFFIRRYNVLTSKNHYRTPQYMRRNLTRSISLIRYLCSIGITDWYQVKDKHIVSYLESTKKNLHIELKRFINYANNDRKPFKKTRLNKKRSGAALKASVIVKTYTESTIDSFLEEIYAKQSHAEYLIAWLVCKLGLTVEFSYNLNISQITVNKENKYIFKPHQVWLKLPKNIGDLFYEIFDQIYPDWRSYDQEKLLFLKPFHSLFANASRASEVIFKGSARELRTTAIINLMKSGFLDRVTLHQSIGVSMPTITKYENIFSVDLHSTIQPHIIKGRNKVIQGEFNEFKPLIKEADNKNIDIISGKVVWYVYLLECENNKIYTGVTSDINNRIFLHYEGKGALMTKLNKPKALLAYKPFSSKSDALSMEQQVKKMPKIGKLLLVKEWNKNSSNFVDVN